MSRFVRISSGARVRVGVWLAVLVAIAVPPANGQTPATGQRTQTPPSVERLGKDLVRLGNVTVNLATREASVLGRVNPVSTLEFLANPPKGLKAYESALTLDSDAITFNAALVLLGLERTHARLLNGNTVDGDRVELWLEIPGTPQRMPADRLIFDRATGKEAPMGTWVYSGSMFLENGRFLADADGVLIGFVHNRAAIIERSETLGIGRYGSVVLNQNLGLQPGATVTLIVKVLAPASSPER